MVTVLKQGTTKKQIKDLLKHLLSKQENKGLDAHRFCGVIKLKKDAVKIQKELRNEWE